MKRPPVPRRLPDGWHRRLDPNGGQVYSCPAQQILVQRPLCSDTWRIYCRGQQLPDHYPTAPGGDRLLHEARRNRANQLTNQRRD